MNKDYPAALPAPAAPSGGLLRTLRAASKPQLVAACLELARRYDGATKPDVRETIDGPNSAARAFRGLGHKTQECLQAIYLVAQNHVLALETLSLGSLNPVRTHPREILFPAVKHLAASFIMAHNHPSGCLDPSTEDVQFTASIRSASDLFGIELFDHLIITRDGYTSLRERGLL